MTAPTPNTPPALAAILVALGAQLDDAGLTRRRGGTSSSVGWAEASGRAVSDSWLELRLHHRPTGQLIQAGLIEYLPLARGGRTVVRGECSHSYTTAPDEAAGAVADEIAGWLDAISTPDATG